MATTLPSAELRHDVESKLLSIKKLTEDHPGFAIEYNEAGVTAHQAALANPTAGPIRQRISNVAAMHGLEAFQTTLGVSPIVIFSGYLHEVVACINALLGDPDLHRKPGMLDIGQAYIITHKPRTQRMEYTPTNIFNH